MFTAFDIVVEVLTVILGVVVLLLGWQVVPRLSFLLHRRAAGVFSVAAALVLVSGGVPSVSLFWRRRAAWVSAVPAVWFLVSEFVEIAEALRPSGPFVVESRIT